MKDEKKMSFCIDQNNRRWKSNFMVIEKKNATLYEQNVWYVMSINATVSADNVNSEQ